MVNVTVGGAKQSAKDTADQKHVDWETEKTNNPSPNNVPALRQRVLALEQAYDALYALVQELSKGN